jgi:MerR HTH family regulatory protein
LLTHFCLANASSKGIKWTEQHVDAGMFMMRKPRDTRFLKSAEVAEALDISKVTLKTWLRTGKVQEPNRDPNNGYRLWTPQDVEAIRRIRKEGELA